MARKHVKVQVSRLRISYVGTRIHGAATAISGPNAFAGHLLRLGRAGPPVTIAAGLEATLPFDSDDPVAWSFWEAAKEAATKPGGRLRPPANLAEAKALFAARIPLRHRAKLFLQPSSSFQAPRLEALLHPFGWVALATVDLVWEQPVSLQEAAQMVDVHEADAAQILLASSLLDTTVAESADATAGRLSQLLANDEPWSPGVHRLATVISGTVDPDPSVPAPRGGDLLKALHQLAGGTAPLPDPTYTLVPRWDGARRFIWDPGDYVYMLRAGTSVVLPRAVALRPAAKGEGTSGRHRRLALLLACLSANAGLVHVNPGSQNQVAQAWATKNAFWLGRLYGPQSPAADYWGLECRSYLDMSPIKPAIEKLLGGELFAAPGVQSPDRYP